MASLLVRLKILPSDATIKPAELSDTLESTLPENMTIRSKKSEPIAFGLEALLADFVVPDEEGMIDKLEEAARANNSVGQVEVVGMSRLSTKLK